VSLRLRERGSESDEVGGLESGGGSAGFMRIISANAQCFMGGVTSMQTSEKEGAVLAEHEA
jgi:hypothetical protein